MKKQSSYRHMLACLVAALTLLGPASAVRAAAPALNGALMLRPLTPTEVATYGLSATNEVSAGLATIAIGQPAYLEAMATLTNTVVITNVTWTLATNPPGSMATLLASPLGTNVPVFNPADKTFYKVAGRAFLRPDAVGTYTVNVKIQSAGSGSTNLSININGGQYLGLQACASCHSGAFVGVPNIYPYYTNTEHATYFTRAINGQVSSHYNKNCIVCHTLGYDTNSFAISDGFYDWATFLKWQFPAVLTNNPSNWAAMPSQLQNLANIQCEHCHGAGNLHQYSNLTSGNTNAISISYGAGDCAQCHDSLNSEYEYAAWANSLHAKMTRTPSGSSSRIACVRCHTAPGFINYVNNMAAPAPYATNYNYEAVTCQACHDPHDASNPYQLRTGTNFTLSDGTLVTNAGTGGFCFNCHNSRNGSVTNSLVQYPLLQTTWNGGSAFGPHDSPQADMLEGVNAVTYGQVIASAPHASVVSNTCVGCHYQPIASTDPAFTKAGGHSTLMSYVNSAGATVDVTYVCTQCHGAITNFDMLVPDYVGVGYSLGIQTQVQLLLNKLSALLPPSGYQANPNNYVADGLVKSPSTQTNWPAKFLQAAYNWQFVNADGSLGVHNGPYAVGLLKASIGNLTGDANNDGMPDVWQSHYFGPGFATNSAAGPNAVNNSAGVPNWMMYALGLAPNAGFTVGNSGVIYFNGNNIVNGATNTVAIYTAAEIAFNTQVGTTYQIQGNSALTGGWVNISTNIPGTGGSISYLTPTRGNAQMFFRVAHTP
jgi:hypothetical protein